MFVSFQNDKTINDINQEELLNLNININEIVDLNLRNTTIINLEGYFPELAILDLRDSFNLQFVNINAPKLKRIFLRNSVVKNLNIKSEMLYDLSLKKVLYLSQLDLNTPKLEYVEFDTDELTNEILDKLLNLASIKAVNNIYNKQIPKEIKIFKLFEHEIKSGHKVTDCSCSLCQMVKSSGLIYR